MVHGRGAVATGRWRRLAVLCLALFLAWACVNFFLFPPAVQSPAHASRSIHTSPILLNKGTWETGPGEALCANEASICEHREALENLRGTIRGQVLCKGMDVYTLSARVFNALRDKEPGVVVRPLTVEDIKAALQAAANFNMTVTVKCGGHNPAGLATNDCGMLIDMYYMRGVHWDSDLHIIAEGGALWKHVHPLLAEANRSIVGGGCPDVGVVGLVVGGGVGWTSRSHGLAADNVLEATVVLPNSTVVTVDTDNQPDLFWALKGAGGSNFGVVASVKLRTFPAHDHYFAGQFCFHRRENDTADVLRVHGKVLQARDMDDRLTVDLFSSRHPPGEGDGDGYLPIRMCYGLFFDGPIDEALVIAKGVLEDLSTLVDEETACSAFKKLCTDEAGRRLAQRQAVQWFQRGEPFLQNHTFTTWSRQYGSSALDIVWKSLMVDQWTQDIEKIIVNHFRDLAYLDAPGFLKDAHLQLTTEHLGGAMSRLPPSSAVWKHRSAVAMISVQAYIPHSRRRQPRDSEAYRRTFAYLKNWAVAVHGELRGYSTGAYANYADGDLDDWEDEYYGSDLYSSLMGIKSQISGADIFRGEQRIAWRSSASQGMYQVPVSHMWIDDSNKPDSWPGQTDEPVVGLLPSPHSHPALKASKECPDWLLDTMENSGNLSDLISRSHQIAPDVAAVSGARLTAANAVLDNERPLLMGSMHLVTGGSGGIGRSAVLHLARLGSDVIFTSTTQEGCQKAEEEMTAQLSEHSGSGRIACGVLQLQDFDSVRAFVVWINHWLEDATAGELDGIILNVGYAGGFKFAPAAGNASLSLAVNHLGHFLLANLLLAEGMVDPVVGKIIVQSSYAAALGSAEKVEKYIVVPPEPYAPVDPTSSFKLSKEFQDYGAGKALNLLFALELQRRVRETSSQVDVLVAVPVKTTSTGLTSHVLENPKWAKEVTPSGGLISTAEAALACVFLAAGHLPSSEELPIFTSCTEVPKIYFPVLRAPEGFACSLWATSLSVVGLSDTLVTSEMDAALKGPCP